jgi:hypothetical protein
MSDPQDEGIDFSHAMEQSAVNNNTGSGPIEVIPAEQSKFHFRINKKLIVLILVLILLFAIQAVIYVYSRQPKRVVKQKTTTSKNINSKTQSNTTPTKN